MVISQRSGRKKRSVDSVPAISVLGLGVEPARVETVCSKNEEVGKGRKRAKAGKRD